MRTCPRSLAIPRLMHPAHPTPAGGAFSRRFAAYSGIFFDEFVTDSTWVRETGTIRLPPLPGVRELILRGEVRTHPAARGIETAPPTLAVYVNGRHATTLHPANNGP